MKKLLCLGFTALMMLFAMPSIVRAEGEGDEPTTPEVTTLTSPTFTPASGATITPQTEIEFTLPNDVNVADYSGGAFILYVENKPDVTLESDVKTLFAALTAAMGSGGSPMEEDGDTPVAPADPEYEIGVFYSVEDDGSDVMTLKPIIISTESGAVAFRARLAVIDNSNEILYSEIMTANYTVGGDVVVVKPTAPTFSLEEGAVSAGAKLTLSNGYTGAQASMHPIYYIINGNESDFTSITTLQALEASTTLKSYDDVKGIKIDEGMTILAATAEIDMQNGVPVWSDVISKTYTIKPKVQIALSANTWDGTTESALPKFTVTAPEGITIGTEAGNVAVKVDFFKNGVSPEVTFEQYIATTDETPMANPDGKLTEGSWTLSYSLVKGDDHLYYSGADVEVAESAMQLTVGTVTSTVFATITITPIEWTIGDEDGVMISTSLSEESLTLGTAENNVAMLITFTNGETVQKHLVTSNFVSEFIPTTVGLTAGVWTLSYKFGKGNSTVDDFEELDNITVAQGAPTTLTVKAAEEPAAYFTITPEPTEEGLEAGTEITVTCNNTDAILEYKWFETEADAKAAERGEWADPTVASSKPVLTAETPVLRVVAIDDDKDEVIADTVVVYTIKAGETPVDPDNVAAPVFNPAAGAVDSNSVVTIAKGEADSIFVAIGKTGDFAKYLEDAEVTISKDSTVIRAYAMKDGKHSDTVENLYTIKRAADVDEDKVEAPVFSLKGEVKEGDTLKITCATEDAEIFYALDEAEFVKYEQGIVITKAVTVKAYAKKGEKVSDTVSVSLTIKSVANEGKELAGVRIYPNPSEGDFNVVVPANAQVEIFNAAGMIVKRVNVNAGVNAMRLENSGIYFVRVSANGQVAIKKVVIR